MSGAGPRLERLEIDHDLSSFDCGNAGLNGWLTRHALAAQRMDSARTFLLLDGKRTIGYFSLTMGSVRRKDAPARLVRGMPGYPVGIVLLARLAVERSHQGRGFGGLLLAEALRRAVSAGESAAARLLVVDAADDAAAAFYERWGSVEAPEHPLRLYRRLSDIRASLE
ncbi:MAG: GNAT family N-acetyltransferase [Solirubrobacteraceae bacterium]